MGRAESTLNPDLCLVDTGGPRACVGFAMALGFHQNMRQGLRQDMLLLPKMLQAVEILQIPTLELDRYLREAVQENEALHLEEPHSELESGPYGPRRTAEDSARFDAWLENQPEPEGGLVAHLEAELALTEVTPELEGWVRLLLGALDERGLLEVPDDVLLEFAHEEGLVGDEEMLGRAIGVLQSLEPRGVGGRNLVEALLLQLDPADPDYAELCALLEKHLDEVVKNKLPQVAREMQIDQERLQELLGRLRELELSPGRSVAATSPRPIRPEVIVEEGTNGFEVRIDGSGLPTVRLDEDVKALVKDPRTDVDVRRYLRNKLDRARWIVDALEQRRTTLLRIATHVFERQKACLEKGLDHLVPLRLTEVAEALDIHVSTVSRAVAEKYAETPWGTIALRELFPAPAGTDDDTTRDSLQEAVKAIFAGEDPTRPLSDDEVVKLLVRDGVKIARRTVAKYRRELGIPSSYRRRKYA